MIESFDGRKALVLELVTQLRAALTVVRADTRFAPNVRISTNRTLEMCQELQGRIEVQQFPT